LLPGVPGVLDALVADDEERRKGQRILPITAGAGDAGSRASIRGATPEASMISSNAASGIIAAGALEQPHRLGLARPRRPAR
jgi:hypothetical protein